MKLKIKQGLAVAAAVLGVGAVAVPAAQASSQYPYPSGLIGSKSSSGSTLDPTRACFPQANGGASNSAYEEVHDRLLFASASRGRTGTATFTVKTYFQSTYAWTCYIQYVYKNGYGVQERQQFVVFEYGHGDTVTGRNEQSWTGNVPFYTEGDSRNGAPLYVCTNRWAPTTAC